MAKYPKRQKVKRYRRSFYSREMRVKKGIGIAVLVLVVLAAAWVAAPHVLDWATHTWYTVVRNRDLSASSPAGGSASSEAESTASFVAEEPAASSEAQPEVVTPAVDGTAIVEGAWAEADLTTLTDDAAIRAAAQQLAAQGAKYAVVTLKDAAGARRSGQPCRRDGGPGQGGLHLQGRGPDPGGEACRLPGPRRCPRGSRHGHPV